MTRSAFGAVEFLRTLIEKEITSHDRLTSGPGSRPQPSWWPRPRGVRRHRHFGEERDVRSPDKPRMGTAKKNLCLIGPDGTARVTFSSPSATPPSTPVAGFRRFTTAELVETLTEASLTTLAPRHRSDPQARPHHRRGRVRPARRERCPTVLPACRPACERRHSPSDRTGDSRKGGSLPEHTTAAQPPHRLLPPRRRSRATRGESYRTKQARTSGARTPPPAPELTERWDSRV